MGSLQRSFPLGFVSLAPLLVVSRSGASPTLPLSYFQLAFYRLRQENMRSKSDIGYILKRYSSDMPITFYAPYDLGDKLERTRAPPVM
jgi:hypothetical protein